MKCKKRGFKILTQYYCNQCKYYMGVHNVQGHAPCSKKGIPGVLWNDRCDQFQTAKEGEQE